MPLDIVTDPLHGGRWTSLASPGREWLWHRPDPARQQAGPGAEFVDAGGLEECFPTVRGTPDHGDVWSRPWTREGATDSVQGADFALRRTIRATPGGAEADYVLTAEPGYRFVWAAHALLDLSPAAGLHLPDGASTRLFPEAAALVDRPWPDGAPWITGTWPDPCGVPLQRIGPDDGTAVGAVVDAGQICVHDGPDRLHLALTAGEQPMSVALWRNLGGFPAHAPYRSNGVEPMLGRVFDLAEAGPDDAARVPASGEVRWRLTLGTTCRCP